MQIVPHLNAQSNLMSCGSISFHLHFHAFISKAVSYYQNAFDKEDIESPMLTHVRCLSAWKWPLCTHTLVSNLCRPNCVPFQTVAQGYVWVLNIIPLKTPQTL